VQDAQHFDAFCIVREEDKIAIMARDAQALAEVGSGSCPGAPQLP